jgi:hypothetical protein
VAATAPTRCLVPGRDRELRIADWAMRQVRDPAELSAWAHLRLIGAHLEAMAALKAGGLLRSLAADLVERWPVEPRPVAPFERAISTFAREHHRDGLQ